MSKSEHARKPSPVLVTDTFTAYKRTEDGWVGYPASITWRERPTLRKDEAKRNPSEGPRPQVTKAQALHEGWMDLMDVRDEQAIAADGITGLPPFPKRMTCAWEYEALVQAMFPKRPSLGLDADLRPKVAGAIATSETPSDKVAVRMDATTMAKAKRRKHIEAEMAQGVRFPDLDPYTLEPIRTSMRGSVTSMVRSSKVRYF